jgi:ABC-2 type transport system permease protein
LNPGLQAFARMLTYWLHDHPEISVSTTQNVLFFYGCTLLTPVGIFALGVAMPILITRDLASSAIVIYSSKAVTRGDYLLGKFCIAFGVLTLTWLGPLCAAWLVGNLLAPDWQFFWHSRAALANVLVYGLASMTILSALALGMSAVSSKEKTTPALWFMWWVLGYVIQPIALNTKPWLRHLSFNYNLEQIRLATFRLGDEVKTAQDHIPILGDMLRNIPDKTMESLNSPTILGSVVALSLMLAAAAVIIRKRVRPE